MQFIRMGCLQQTVFSPYRNLYSVHKVSNKWLRLGNITSRVCIFSQYPNSHFREHNFYTAHFDRYKFELYQQTLDRNLALNFIYSVFVYQTLMRQSRQRCFQHFHNWHVDFPHFNYMTNNKIETNLIMNSINQQKTICV